MIPGRSFRLKKSRAVLVYAHSAGMVPLRSVRDGEIRAGVAGSN